MNQARFGKINVSKTHHCSLEKGHFLISKTQPERYTIKLLFKVQVSPDHPTSKTNLEWCFTSIPFCELYRAFNGISFTNALPFFFQTDWNFYQIILSNTLSIGPNKSLIKKISFIQKALKVYNCFNLKEDSFNVNQL